MLALGDECDGKKPEVVRRIWRGIWLARQHPVLWHLFLSLLRRLSDSSSMALLGAFCILCTNLCINLCILQKRRYNYLWSVLEETAWA